jgi:hypothetical protein
MSSNRFEANVVINAVPVDPNHAVRLIDLENAVGQHYKESVRVVATTNISGFAAGTISDAGVFADIDGVTVDVGDRILLIGQLDMTQNGIYTVADLGDPWSLTRAADFDSSSDIFSGVKIHVNQGTSHHDQTFILVTDNPITLDSTSLRFELVSDLIKAIKERVFTLIADGSTTEYVYNHLFGSRLVTVTVIDQTDWSDVFVPVQRIDVNNVKLTFALPPAAGRTFSIIIRTEVTPA